MGEVMDFIPDSLVGRKTTATVLGVIKTKVLIIGLVFTEIALLLYFFGDFIFAGVLTLGVLWLLLDLLLIYRNRTYTLPQMKFFALASNIIAFITITYVWYSGRLLSLK